MSISLKNLSVSFKTYMICGVFIGGMLCIAGISAVLMNNVENEMIEIAEEDVPLIRALTSITVNGLEQAILVEKILPSHKQIEELEGLSRRLR